MAEEGRSAQEWTKIILRRILFLCGPIAVYGVFLFAMWFVYPPATGIIGQPSQEYLTLFALFIAYLIPPFGKESIIPIAIGLGYPIWIICFGIILMDMMSSILIALNFDLLEKIPFVGGLIRRFMDGANSVRKKKPWIEQLSHLGLLIFMYIPLQGSGATNTTILGRLFGMRARTVFWIITVGSIFSTLSVAFGAAAVIELWRINPWLAVLAVLVIAAVIIAAVLVWRRYTQRFSPENPACSCDSNEEDILP
ncbi:small multi-drug export protein [Methanocorpusculum sp. MG]|uniref:Small multi-drug export protein n=1 Tax=Methanocorpusculum petauri TaxID=3002863 RepID=A0ABT4IH52_9EURY|nr:small multi-drug export protein [Methanocorpusculum petauri]MCZ0861071.1 small multi-drug export protein [Methanocorpusculum petauri]MDE2443556.1 small multi-drug export protein [Methanocorpusculum sp.]